MNKIKIINKGDTPDRDAELRYYLVKPNNEPLKETITIFEEVPPLIYDEERCITYEDAYMDKVTGNCITIINAELPLPEEKIYGQWLVVAEYHTEIQPKLKVQDNFFVVRQDWLAIILIIGVIFAYFRSNHKKIRVKKK